MACSGRIRRVVAVLALVASASLGACLSERWPEEYVSTGTMYSDVAAGESHTCGMTDGGEIDCWGCGDPESDHGQCDLPDTSNLDRLYAGAHATCGLENGMMTCWGTTDITLKMTGGLFADGDFTTATVGGNFACATDGEEAHCWGDHGSWLPNTTIAVNSSLDVQTIVAGYGHYCVIQIGGTVVCAGDDESGQASVPEDLLAADIASGATHTCAVRDSGEVLCWGCEGSDYGQCDVPDEVNAGLDSQTGAIRQISVGRRHSCALKQGGEVLCWGCEDEDGSQDDELCRSAYLFDQMEFISAGSDHTCGRSLNNHIVCWGANDAGQRDPP